MQAAIVSIGNEVVRGRIVDTNAAWLAEQLTHHGYDVRFHLAVGDDVQRITEALQWLVDRVNLVVATGGLGPTQDDLTRDALATLVGQPLVEDSHSLARIQARFEATGRSMPEANRVQALVPRGARAIPNDYGTAPGIWLAAGSARTVDIIALPGVPAEMKRMFTERVLPELLARRPSPRVLVERKLHAFGLGESHVEERLRDLTRRGQDPEVGITVHQATITLRVTTGGKNEREARNRMEPVVRTIYERLGELIYGEDDDTLEEVLLRELDRLRLTLAVCEGITGGLVQECLSRVPGASRWFRGGLVLYANDCKLDLLAVPAEQLEEHGAVSEAVARHLAEAVRIRFRADLGLATVGWIEPSDEGDPLASVWVAAASEHAVTAQPYRTKAERNEARVRAAKAAMNHLRLRLRKARPR